MSDETFRIRPLKWSSWERGASVRTLFGEIAINNAGPWSWHWRISDFGGENLPSLADAKAAAEQWYVAKLLEALTPVDTAPLEAAARAALKFISEGDVSRIQIIGAGYDQTRASLIAQLTAALEQKATP